MIKVITYGTYDLLHYGHIRLLERAKALGDYLIVGVTSDDFDKRRGKINNKQSLEERIAAIEKTGLADKIIVEEYEGQKIEDIKKYGVDIFTVGSDWEGHFNYLNEFCKVTYLSRTTGISSSEERHKLQEIRIGIVGSIPGLISKFVGESKFVNGVKIVGLFDPSNILNDSDLEIPLINTINELYSISDAIYISSEPNEHYQQIKEALLNKKSVLCESPITLNRNKTIELFDLAKENDCILQEGMKTAYSTAYGRMMLLLKSKVIGKIVSVKSTCTSLSTVLNGGWSGTSYWTPTALLPIFQIFGTKYSNCVMVKKKNTEVNDFATVFLVYPDGTAVVNSGSGVKSEGDLVISGTKGYVYVPSPWWKTDYFEIRFENPADNRKYFYQLDGEGIRYEIVDFIHSVKDHHSGNYVDREVSIAISQLLDDLQDPTKVTHLND